MRIVDVAAVPSGPNPHGVDVRKIYDTEHAATVHITLQPGESLKLHKTPVDVFFYVLEGTGIVRIGDEEKEVGSDHLVDSPANIPHLWRNEGDAVFRVLVVKVPRPTAETKLL